jgi:hypothetical protein
LHALLIEILILGADVAVFSGNDVLGKVGNLALLDGVAGLELVVISGWDEVFGNLLASINDGGFSVLWVDGGRGEADEGNECNNGELENYDCTTLELNCIISLSRESKRELLLCNLLYLDDFFSLSFSLRGLS